MDRTHYPESMSPPPLARLFTAEVYASSGLVNPSQIEELAHLGGDQVPPGYDRWVEKRKREFRCGRHHARLALEAAGSKTTHVPRDDDGVPLFPPGFFGSITHTGRTQTFGAAVVAKSPIRVGLDAENQQTLSQDMMTMVLSAAEVSALTSASTERLLPSRRALGDLALIAFSAKEAFYKCTYPEHRTFLGFHDVEFSLHEKLEHIDRGTVLGSFELRLLRVDVPKAPTRLAGRFLQLEERVLSGVEWEVPSIS